MSDTTLSLPLWRYPGLHREVLPNGMRLLVLTLPRDAVAIDLHMDAGAVDELSDEHGIAHLIEHMLFKGTTTRAVGESAAAIEAYGGDLNAWTSMDHTSVHAVLDATGWRDALDVIADMVCAPRIDPDELTREIEVVIEELRSYEDDPESHLSDHVQEAAWGSHPYGRRIIGTERELRGHDAARLRRFFERELGPNRARLAVVGPVSPAEAREAAIAAFDGWRPAEPRAPIPAPPEAPSQHTVSIRPRFDSNAAELVWHVPAEGHPDHAALAVLAHVLGNGNGAELVTDLQHDERLVTDVWASLTPALAGATFSVGFTPLEATTRAAIAKTLERIDSIGRNAPGSSVQRARSCLIADYLFLGETVDGLAQELVRHDALWGDPERVVEERAELGRVEVEDVERVARTWLSRERAVIGVADSRLGDTLSRAALERPFTRKVTHTTVGRPSPVAGRPETLRIEHSSGAVVLVTPDDSPVVGVRVASPGGELRSTASLAGLVTAWGRTALSGAGPFEATALGQLLDDLATELEPSVGSQSLGFSATVPRQHLVELLDLVGHLLLDPHFADDDVEHTRAELLEDQRTRMDYADELAGDLAASLRWRGHPLQLPSLGTPESVAKISSKALRKLHDDHFDGKLVIAVCGGVTPRVVEDALKWLDHRDRKVAPLPARAAPKPALHGVHTLRAGNEQAHVRLVAQGHPQGAFERRSLELAAAILDGQAGRLFLDLRERQGLAYEVWVSNSELLDGGTFTVGLATSPDQVDAAATGLRRALEALREPPSEAELERARRLICGRIALGQQRTMSRAATTASYELFGVPAPLAVVRDRLAAVTAREVADDVAAMLDGGVAEIRVLPRS